MEAIRRAGLEKHLAVMADTIAEPDEVWARITRTSRGRYLSRTTYLAQWLIDGVLQLVAVDLGPSGWTAAVGSETDLSTWRRGVRLHRRK